MTKTQARARINKLFNEGILGKLDNAICSAIEELEDLIYDCEDTRDSIEPYEDKDDLTEEQQERYEWFDDLVSELESFKSDLEDWQSTFGDHQMELEDRA